MPKGGKRSNAGRKPGVPNKRTQELREAMAKGGQLPLEYMLTVMRNKKADPSRRDDMAKAAAPFLHHRLASIEQTVTGKDGEPLIPQHEPRQVARAIVAILGEAAAK